MDASARITMKDAAKCDKLCEWQNSANQENAERILHFQVIPESMLCFRALILYMLQNASSACDMVAFCVSATLIAVDA